MSVQAGTGAQSNYFSQVLFLARMSATQLVRPPSHSRRAEAARSSARRGLLLVATLGAVIIALMVALDVAEIGLMRVVPVAALVLLPGLPGALQPSPAGSILRWICRQFAAPRYCPWLAGEVGDGQRDLDFSGSAPRPIVAPSPSAAIAGAPPPAAPTPVDSRKSSAAVMLPDLIFQLPSDEQVSAEPASSHSPQAL